MKVSNMKILDEEITCWKKSALRNTFFLKLHVCLSKALGIHPLVFRNRTSLVGQIYSITLFGLLIIVSVWSGLEMIIQESQGYSIFQRILNGMGSIAVIFFFAILLFNSLTKEKSWKSLKRSLLDFDEFFVNDVEKCDGKRWKISLFILARLCALSLIILDELLWYEKNQEGSLTVTKAYWTFQFGLLYQIVISTLLKEFSELVKSRYEYLHQYVKIILHIHVDNNFSKVEFHNEIQKMKKMYKLLFMFVQNVNDIFGNVLVVSFVLIMAIMLSDISASLNYVNLADYFDIILLNLAFWIAYLVSFHKTILQV